MPGIFIKPDRRQTNAKNIVIAQIKTSLAIRRFVIFSLDILLFSGGHLEHRIFNRRIDFNLRKLLSDD